MRLPAILADRNRNHSIECRGFSLLCVQLLKFGIVPLLLGAVPPI